MTEIYNVINYPPSNIKKMKFYMNPEGLNEYYFTQFRELKSIELVNYNFLYPINPLVNDIIIHDIPGYAFQNCTKLESVKISAGFNNVGVGAFRGCINLKEITFSDGLVEIGNSAFFGCVKLNKINLPDSITDIGVNAFMYCDNLKKITLPRNLRKISSDLFFECDNIKEWRAAIDKLKIPINRENLAKQALSDFTSYTWKKRAKNVTLLN